MPDEVRGASYGGVDVPGEASRPAWHASRHPQRRPYRLMRRFDEVRHAEDGVRRQPDGAVQV